MKFFVDADGNYLGQLLTAPNGAVEVAIPPQDARQKWLGDHWGPIPALVPGRITRRQGRLALLQAGHLADVEAAMGAIEDPTERMAAQIEYEAETWERANPWIDRTGQAVGLTTEQIDALFIAAATL